MTQTPFEPGRGKGGMPADRGRGKTPAKRPDAKPRAVGRQPESSDPEKRATMRQLRRRHLREGTPSDLPLAWMLRFVAVLRRTGNVSKACRRSGISRQCAYEARNSGRYPSFTALWDDAVEDRLDALEERLVRHAILGVEEPVFGSLPGEHAGSGIVGYRRKYDHRLGVRILEAKRPEEWGRGRGGLEDDDEAAPGQAEQRFRDFVSGALASIPGASSPPSYHFPAERPGAGPSAASEAPPVTGRAPQVCVECGARLPPASRKCGECGSAS